MKIDHVHFYTRNAARTRDWFIDKIGFKAIGNCIGQDTHTEVIALNSACFVISSPLNQTSPVAEYLNSHPSGIVDIAFRVPNLAEIINRACSLNIRLLQDMQLWRSPESNSRDSFQFAQIAGWNGLRHTLVETKEELDYCLPCLPLEINHHQITSKNTHSFPSYITNIDHVVLNVAQGKLDSAVKLYQTLFKFKVQQNFNIHTNKSGLTSAALIDARGEVQFNINQPTSTNSQIQEFIEVNGGSGIQHLALRSQNLIADVNQMQQRNLAFLTVPQAYYRSLKQLLPLNTAEKKAISQQQILVDCDRTSPQSLLMQIFTQPIFEQPTFFLEFIERRQEAQGFGQGNFQALFEAVEREQGKRVINSR